MHWTSFMIGLLIGSILFDLLWRATFHLSQKLITSEREYIDELREYIDMLEAKQ